MREKKVQWFVVTAGGVLVVLGALFVFSAVQNNVGARPVETLWQRASRTASSVFKNHAGSVAGNATTTVDVSRVVDGDTVDVIIDGKDTRVRLLGINTPETVDPRKPVQCFGKEASDEAKRVLTGQRVRLEADPTQDDTDKYGRLLRYVFLADGTDFDEMMIRKGFAFEYTYHVPYEYQAAFKAAQKEASAAKRGLWAKNTCDGKLIPAKP